MRNNILLSVFLILFTVSMSFGKWNPAGLPIGTASLGMMFIIPIFIHVIVSGAWSNVLYYKWRSSLVVFFFAIFFTALIGGLKDGLNAEVYELWYKLLGGIMTCMILHVLFKNNHYLHLSMLIYTVTMILISIFYQIGVTFLPTDFRNGRLWLYGENPNSTSGRFVVSIIFLLYFVFVNPYKWAGPRFLLLVSLFPMLYMIIASGSRGSLLICAVSLILFFNNLRFRKKTVKFTILIIGLSAMAIYSIRLLNNSDFSMLERFNQTLEEGGDVRTALLNAALNIFLQYPLLGCGISNFEKIMLYDYGFTNTVHNLYGYILAVSGLFGFMPFSIFLLSLVREAIKVIRTNMISSVLLFFILALAWKTGGIITYLFMWYVFSIIISFIEKGRNENILKESHCIKGSSIN